MKLFISYSRDDKAWVYELWRNLRDRAYHDAWIDQRLVPAQDWWETILLNIETCECCIYVMTPHSVASIYCRAEVDYAVALNKPILPLMLKTCDYPDNLRKMHVQYQIIKDDMTLGDVLFIIERAIGEVREGQQRGKYQPPKSVLPRPDEPKPSQTPEQILEVFTLAEEAVGEKNLSLAEKHFKQVIEMDPQGYGPAAAQRLEEIRYEHVRSSEYNRIAHMVTDPALRKGASTLWQVFVQRYGTDYDPGGVAVTLSEQATTTPPHLKPETKAQSVPETPPARSVPKLPTEVLLPPLSERESIAVSRPTYWKWAFIAMIAVAVIIIGIFLAQYFAGKIPAATSNQTPTLFVDDPADDIAFLSSGTVYLVNADGTNLRPITSENGDDYSGIAWSPDASRILLALYNYPDDQKHNGIYVMNLDGSNVQRLTGYDSSQEFATTVQHDHPAWSPDGSLIIFNAYGDAGYQLYMMENDGSNLRRFNEMPSTTESPSWSPDGQTIVFDSSTLEGSTDWNFEIYTIGRDGSDLRRLTQNNAEDFFAHWSPDGKHIAFSSNRDGQSGIYVMDTNGNNQRRLTSNPSGSNDWFPTWSPDGRQIAFSRSDRIYLVDVDGNNLRPLNIEINGYSPVWRP